MLDSAILKDSLRKKQLMASFRDRLKKGNGNIKHIFQSLIAKFDQKMYSTLP